MADLQADVDAAAGPAATVALLERVRTALARFAQFELANLKCMLEVDGMTEAEIHPIIPDRPVAKKSQGASSQLLRRRGIFGPHVEAI